jgi:hypothetical protein
MLQCTIFGDLSSLTGHSGRVSGAKFKAETFRRWIRNKDRKINAKSHAG